MDEEGIEPSTPECKSGVFPLNYKPTNEMFFMSKFSNKTPDKTKKRLFNMHVTSIHRNPAWSF